ncbi:MAG: rhomboid family intramembrane serine protease [Flavobacteriales bacterium]|nr:rhomboid family intramembrane serine protease [Flavobacteriales bacterium]
MICWMLWLSEEFFGYHLKQFGMRPRELRGLIGVITMHFLHGDFTHIGQNTLSFVILNVMLFFFYRGVSWKVFLRIAIIGGALLWLWGRSSNHIGASLIIYGLAAFVFFSGVFRRDEKMLRISLVVAFYFGSIVWWVFPIDPSISWEGHMSGSVVGIALAWLYRGQGPIRDKYQWEIDEELEKERLEGLSEDPFDYTGEGRITYDFKPKEKPSEDSEGS